MKRGHEGDYSAERAKEGVKPTAREEKLGQVPQIEEIHPSRYLCVALPV